MKVYALALSARNQEMLSMVVAATNRARSEYEAIGIGIEMAEKTWPEKDGWGSYQCSALEIPAYMFPGTFGKSGKTGA